MAKKSDLQDWILNALKDLGGEGNVAAIARHIWEHHESDLRASGDLFFTWQYDMRWQGQSLQKAGKLLKQQNTRSWVLK